MHCSNSSCEHSLLDCCWKCKVKISIPVDEILCDEFIFLFHIPCMDLYCGIQPEAHGTEKFMDYGFMAAMMRSETLPAKDIWYSLENMNYYYGGQYYAVFLTKLTGAEVSDTYNLMRTLVAGLLFAMSYSVGYQLIIHMPQSILEKKKKIMASVGGVLSAAAVVFAGNFHYVLYGLLGKAFSLEMSADYWFPNSTRYIGYNPETNDKCIHEFPCYSCTRRSSCACRKYYVCDRGDWHCTCMDLKNQKRRGEEC